jgi:hypothetical protein
MLLILILKITACGLSLKQLQLTDILAFVVCYNNTTKAASVAVNWRLLC